MVETMHQEEKDSKVEEVFLPNNKEAKVEEIPCQMELGSRIVPGSDIEERYLKYLVRKYSSSAVIGS
jgi:hypothetical protein